MDIGDKIKYLRTEILNLSQDKFAKKIDVTRLTVNNWENGLSKPAVEHIKMIALFCKVTTDYLIFDDVDYQLSLNNIDDEQYEILQNIINYFIEKNKKQII